MKWKVLVVYADGSLEEEIFPEEEKAEAKKFFDVLCKVAVAEQIKVYLQPVGKIIPFKRKNNGTE